MHLVTHLIMNLWPALQIQLHAVHFLNAVVLLAVVATGTDPVCGQSWQNVLKWQRELLPVNEVSKGATEVVYYEPVPTLRHSPINVVSEEDYNHLRMKYKEPQRLKHTRQMQGAKTKMMLEIHNGWLLPSGFAVNATHRFQLGILNSINCVQSHLARKVGRANCHKTDWTNMVYHRNADRVTHAEDNSWLTAGVPDFTYECKHISSAISLADTQFADYGHFHESILPRLLWPAVQRLQDSIVIWRFREQGFLTPWLDLMGLSWRRFESMRKPDVAYKFDTLHLPLVDGLDPEFDDNAEVTAHTPPLDISFTRRAAIDSLTESQNVNGHSCYVLLLERDPSLRRALSPKDTRRLRKAVVPLAHAADCPIAYIRGADGGFELGKIVKGTHVDIDWSPLKLSEGLQYFSRAKAAVGVHGSLLMHLFLAPERAHVVDIQTMHTYDLPVYHLCNVLGLHYWYHPVQGYHTSKNLPLGIKRLELLISKVAAQMVADSSATADEL